MAKVREVMEYELEVSGALAKADALNAKLEEMKAARGRGEDTSALEQEFDKQADGLGRLTQKEKQAASATDGLVKQKEKLANVVTLLGGRFGGVVGNLGNVVELLLSGAKSAMAFGGALAGVTAGVLIFQKIRDALREAREEQEKFNEAVAQQQAAKLEVAGQVAAVLGRHDQGTAANVTAAQALHRRLGVDYGLVEPELAATGVAAGIESVEELAVLARLKGRGVPVGTPKEVQRALEMTRRDQTYEALLGKARGHATQSHALDVTAETLIPDKGGPAGESPEALAYRALKKDRKLPEEEMTLAQFQEMLEAASWWEGYEGFRAEHPYEPYPGGTRGPSMTREQIDPSRWILKYVEQVRAAMQGRGAQTGPVAGIEPEVIDTEAIDRTVAKLKPQPTQPQRRESPFGLPASVPGDAGPVPEVAPTIINQDNRQVTNVGTMYNAPSKIPPRWPVARAGNNKHDIRSPAA